MSEIIKKYYESAGVPSMLLKVKMQKLEKHPDIVKEFERWISTGEYQKAPNCITVEGYTAEDISKLSKFVDGEGAFMLLLELRENPVKAKRRITEGFTMK